MTSSTDRHRNRPTTVTTLALAAGLSAGHATAQDNSDGETLEPVVVSGTRTATKASEIARSVTLVDRQEIENQTKFGRNLTDILAQTVPGLAPSTQSASNFGQQLRGRNVQILIDGVPQTTVLRDSGRDLNNIATSSIERIEVVRGGTAVYGFGATGGLINIITKEAAAQGVEAYSQAGTNFDTSDVSESVNYETEHRVSGRSGQFDYVASGSFVERGGRFDADGDRIPPNGPGGSQGGLDDTTEYGLLGKAGLDFDDGDQRIEFMINHFNNEQDTEFTSGKTLEDGDTPAVRLDSLPRSDRPVKDPSTENTTTRVNYEHADLWGSQLAAKVYYSDRSATFPRFGSQGARTFNQSRIESEKHGARATIDTPLDALTSGAGVTWGLDFLSEELDQDLFRFDSDPEQTTPPLDQDATAAFAELEVPMGSIGIVRGGIRHERIDLDVDSISANRFNNPVQKGSLDYAETLFNAGAVFYLSERVDVFANFSQGFSLNSIGRQIADAGPFTTTETIDPEDLESDAKTVDTFEIGSRYFGRDLSASAAVFYSESDNSASFNDNLELQRNDDYVWGFDAQASYIINPRYKVGGSASWSEGLTEEKRPDNGRPNVDQGDRRRLLGTQISPLKLTGYLQQEATGWWRNRIQFQYVGNRNQFEDVDEADEGESDPIFAKGEVKDYFLVDVSSQFDAGPGQLTVSISNLFNEDFKPAINQAFNTKRGEVNGSGRRLGVSYEVKW